MQTANDPSIAHAPLGHSRVSALRHSWDGGALTLPELQTKVRSGDGPGAVGSGSPGAIEGLEAVFSSTVSGEASWDMVRSPCYARFWRLHVC
jgi:hypothetical protein